MSNDSHEVAAQERRNKIGLIAMALAAIALVGAVAHLALGPFEPQQPIERTIAETAVNIKEAAKRAITGEEAPPPAPSNRTLDKDKLMDGTVLAFAGGAMLLAVIAIFLREERQTALIGFTLGGGVLLMSFFQWIAILICVTIILVAVINNLESIIS